MTGEEKASHSTVGFTVAKINTKCTTSAAAPALASETSILLAHLLETAPARIN